jgi:PAS domain S-box-containing protein
MSINALDDLIEKAQDRFQDILQRAESLPEQCPIPKPEISLLAEAIEEVSICLEELQISVEELQQQNEELLVTRIDLETERQRYQDLFNFAPDGYLVTDLYGIIQEANHAISTLLNLSPDFLVGKPLTVFVLEPESGKRNFHSLLLELHQCKEMRGKEIFMQPRQKTAFCAELNVVTVLNSVGEPVGLRWLIRDITERKAIARMKDEFISVVSHELRTPLTSIQGGLSLLASGLIETHSPKGQHIIEIVSESSDRLGRLVEDILNVERLQSGQISLSKQPCNIAELMLNVVDMMQIIANLANITLLISGQPTQVDVDADRIIQVFTNLLGNAIKFSPVGSTIWLTSELVEKTTAASSMLPGSHASTPLPCLVIAIKDQGCGIPAAQINTIFERFQQVDSSDSRAKGGTGLGLAICRYLVEQHGGQIWAESILGKGSSFYFTLPITRYSVGLPPTPNSGGLH